MPKYVKYDPTITPISPVTGWIDTDAFPSISLPSPNLEISEEQWSAHTTNPMAWAVSDGALVAYTPPVPLPVQASVLLTSKIAGGIVITCTGNSALNSTYGLDSTTMTQIGSVASDFASGLGLPGNLDTFTYPDINSNPVTFSGAQIVELYKAQRNLLFVMNTQAAIMANGGTAEWPSQSATIA
jgi:hypothetical protein